MTNHPNRNSDAIAPLSAMLDWKLLNGSHDFPGPDGGTCINEAAIIASGFEYRRVQSANDCPPCFSRPIAAYAINLNDGMPTKLRQRLLMPFVTRLAGTADTDAIEIARATYIAIQTVRRILPIMLRHAGLPEPAEKCASVQTLKEAEAAADAAADAAAYAAADAAAYAAATAAAKAANAAAAYAAYAAYAAAKAAYAAADAAATAAAKAAKAAADAAAYAAEAAADAAADAAAYAAATAAAKAANAAAAYAAYAAYAAAKKEIWQVATAILGEAIALGKQADPLDIKLVSARMETIKQAAREKVAV